MHNENSCALGHRVAELRAEKEVLQGLSRILLTVLRGDRGIMAESNVAVVQCSIINELERLPQGIDSNKGYSEKITQ